MACQTKITQTTINQGEDYLLGVKDKQGKLSSAI
jgi:predicted transposase YbfD/YdcC